MPLLAISAFVLDYPFEQLLYPRALDAIVHLGTLGLPVVLSDGDVVLQPRKITSGNDRARRSLSAFGTRRTHLIARNRRSRRAACPCGRTHIAFGATSATVGRGGSMITDPEDVLEPAALPEQGSDDDETLDDAAQGVSVTSDATADSTDETGEIDAIGRAAGLVVRDDRPFRGIDEVERRDEHRWELDPASAEDASAAEGDPPAR